MTSVIQTIRVHKDVPSRLWCATYGEHSELRAEVVEQFGTDCITTPFSIDTPAADVKARLEELNPHHMVIMIDGLDDDGRFVSIWSDDAERTSSLLLNEECITVMGVLPHNYTFNPKTVADADKLIEWLQAKRKAMMNDSFKSGIEQGMKS